MDNSSDPTQFGMTQEDVNAQNKKEFFLKVKIFFGSIEPVVVKIVSSFFYYLLRFIKAFVSASVRMLMGKEV